MGLHNTYIHKKESVVMKNIAIIFLALILVMGVASAVPVMESFTSWAYNVYPLAGTYNGNGYAASSLGLLSETLFQGMSPTVTGGDVGDAFVYNVEVPSNFITGEVQVHLHYTVDGAQTANLVVGVGSKYVESGGDYSSGTYTWDEQTIAQPTTAWEKGEAEFSFNATGMSPEDHMVIVVYRNGEIAVDTSTLTMYISSIHFTYYADDHDPAFTVASSGGTEYSSDEPINLWVTLTNNTNGNLVTGANCVTNIYNGTGAEIVTGASLTEISNIGTYYYRNTTFGANEGPGYYTGWFNCTKSGYSNYESHSFHIAQWADTIGDINNTVTDIMGNTTAIYNYLQNTIYPAVDQLETDTANILTNQTTIYNKLVDVQNNVTTNYNEIITLQTSVSNLDSNMNSNFTDLRNRLIEINTTTQNSLANITAVVIPKLDQIIANTTTIYNAVNTLESEFDCKETITYQYGEAYTVTSNGNDAAEYLMVNYTQPDVTFGSMIWDVKHGYGLARYNITLPTTCSEQSPIQLRFYSYWNAPGNTLYSHPECYNGTAWEQVGTDHSGSSFSGGGGSLSESDTKWRDGNWSTGSFDDFNGNVEQSSSDTAYGNNFIYEEQLIITQASSTANDVCWRLDLIQNYTDDVEADILSVNNTLNSYQTINIGRFDSIDSNLTLIYVDTQWLVSNVGLTTAQNDTLYAILADTDEINTTTHQIITDLGIMNTTLNQINSTVTSIYDYLQNTIYPAVDGLEADTAAILANQTVIYNKLVEVQNNITTTYNAVVSLESNMASNFTALNSNLAANFTQLNTKLDTLQTTSDSVMLLLNCTSMPTDSVCYRLDLIQNYTDNVESDIATLDTVIDGYQTVNVGRFDDIDANLTLIYADTQWLVNNVADNTSVHLKLDEMLTYAGQINTTVTNIQTDLTTLDSNMGANFTALASQITTLEGNIDANFTQLDNAVTQLGTDISTLDTNMDANFTELDNAVAQLGTDLSTLETNMDANFTEIDNALAALSTTSDNIVDYLDCTNMTTSTVCWRLDLIQNYTDNIEGDIATLDSVIDGYQTTNIGRFDTLDSTLLSNFTDVRNRLIELNSTTWAIYDNITQTVNPKLNTIESKIDALGTASSDLEAYLNCTTMPTDSVCWRLDLIQNYTDNVEGDIATLDSVIDGYQVVNIARFDAIDGNLTELDSAVTQLSSDMGANFTALSSQITTLEGNIDANFTELDNAVTQLGADIDILETNMDANFTELDNAMTQLSTDLGTLETNMDANFTEIDNALAGLSTATDDLEDLLDCTNMTASTVCYRLDLIQNYTDNVESDIATLDTVIDGYQTALINRFDSVDGNLTNIYVDTQLLLTNVGEVNSTVYQLQADLGIVNNTLNALDTYVQGTLTNEVDGVEEQLVQVLANQTVIYNKVVEVQGNVTNTYNLVADARTDIATLSSDMNSNFTALSSQITTLDANIDGNMTELDNELSQLSTDMNNNFTEVDNAIISLESNMNDNFTELDNALVALESNMDANFTEIDNALAGLSTATDNLEDYLDCTNMTASTVCWRLDLIQNYTDNVESDIAAISGTLDDATLWEISAVDIITPTKPIFTAYINYRSLFRDIGAILPNETQFGAIITLPNGTTVDVQDYKCYESRGYCQFNYDGTNGTYGVYKIDISLESPTEQTVYMQDPQHSGTTTELGPTTLPPELWTFTTVNYASQSPAIANGIMYAGVGEGALADDDINLYAFEIETGKVIWNYSALLDGWSYSSPAVANEIVYSSSLDSYLYALDAYTGSQIWNHSSSGRRYSSPNYVDGVIYVGGGQGDYKIYALDSETGSEIWNYSVGHFIYGTPAVAEGVVYIGSYDKKLYALNASTGSELWNYTAGGFIFSSPSVSDGIVYIGSHDDKFYAINASTGSEIWNYSTGGDIYGASSIADGVVYIGSFGGAKMYALNASTGSEIWNYSTGNIFGSPLVSNGVVYAGDELGSNSKMYAWDSSTGDLLWNYTVGWYIDTTPTLSNGVIYFGASDNTFYALGTPQVARVGEYQWTHTFTFTNTTNYEIIGELTNLETRLIEINETNYLILGNITDIVIPKLDQAITNTTTIYNAIDTLESEFNCDLMNTDDVCYRLDLIQNYTDNVESDLQSVNNTLTTYHTVDLGRFDDIDGNLTNIYTDTQWLVANVPNATDLTTVLTLTQEINYTTHDIENDLVGMNATLVGIENQFTESLLIDAQSMRPWLYAGETLDLRVNFNSLNGSLMDPDSANVTIYSDADIIMDTGSMTKTSTGEYYYKWVIPVHTGVGKYRLHVEAAYLGTNNGANLVIRVFDSSAAFTCRTAAGGGGTQAFYSEEGYKETFQEDAGELSVGTGLVTAGGTGEDVEVAGMVLFVSMIGLAFAFWKKLI